MIFVTVGKDAAKFADYRREVHICFFGVYCWEILVSLWFEYRLCLRQLPFKWPLIVYFLARYLALGGAIASMLEVYAKTPLNCHAILQSSYFLSHAAVFFASCNLMIRAIIIWAYRWYVMIPLIALAIGQCALFVIAFRIKGGSWDAKVLICTNYEFVIQFLGAYSIYTTMFDFVILIMSIIGLKRVTKHSSFADALRRQGITYFVTVFVFHTLITIAVFVTHETVYSAVPSYAAITITPALSCRMVRSTLKVSGPHDMDGESSLRWRRAGTPSRTSAMEDHGCQFSTHIDLGSPDTVQMYVPKSGELGPRGQALP